MNNLSDRFRRFCTSASSVTDLSLHLSGLADVHRVWRSRSLTAKRGRRVISVEAFGVESDLGNEIRPGDVSVTQGRAIAVADVVSRARICVIGSSIAKQLFEPNENPIGQTIRVHGTSFLVVGVIGQPSSDGRDSRTGPTLVNTPEDDVLMPFSSVPDAWPRSYQLVLTLRDARDATKAEVAIISALRAAIKLPDSARLEVLNRALSYGEVEKTAHDISLRATLIGSTGLWVALVGLVNVLFISFRGRASEIGVLRAFGATRRMIAISVLSEALVISSLGCVIGLGLAVGLASILGRIADVPVWIPPAWAGVVVLCMVVASCLAALLPASQAASVDPVVALRTE